MENTELPVDFLIQLIMHNCHVAVPLLFSGFSKVAHLMRMSPVCAINAVPNVFCHQLFCNICQTLKLYPPSARQDTTFQLSTRTHAHTQIDTHRHSYRACGNGTDTDR